MRNQKYIVYSLILFLFISFSWLIFLEKKQHQISDGWFIYFNNPLNESSDFVIENYSTDQNFYWELSLNDEILKKEEVQVLKNNKKNVTLGEIVKGKSIKITVFHSKKTKEIYKNFE